MPDQYENSQNFGKALALGKYAPIGCPDVSVGVTGIIPPKYIEVTYYQQPSRFFLATCRGEKENPICEKTCNIKCNPWGARVNLS